MGVFTHECIVLWVVKTTLLYFPGEYAIAPIVYPCMYIFTINSILFCKLDFTYYTLK